MRDQPVAHLVAAVSRLGNRVLQVADEGLFVSMREESDAFAIEGLVYSAHGGLADRVRKTAAPEDGDAHRLGVAFYGLPKEVSPGEAALEARQRGLDAVDDHRHEAGQPLELHAP